MSAQEFLDGKLLLIDKPLKWTSFQVVNKLRWAIRKRFNLKKIKVGHAGTLDPLATGLLVICTGKFTKKIESYQAQEKEYTGTITLGATTPSYDLESDFDATFDTSDISEDSIREAIATFEGDIMQHPPAFSAIKKDGKRLYELARKGKEVKTEPRPVSIYAFEVTSIEMPHVHFRVQCSKGTYIRSLAHDLGKALNNGAHLSALRRTKIGNMDVQNAQSIESFIETLGSPSEDQ